MNDKFVIYLCIFIGSTLGSLLPNLWGAGIFSISSIILGAIGGLLGLYFSSKLI